MSPPGGRPAARPAARGRATPEDGAGFDEVARELYGVVPARFVATRDACAKDARACARPELARAIGKLRKPTAGAWLANLLVRERPEEVAALLELARSLHGAQARLAGGELRTLSQQRHELVSSLGRAGAQLGRAAGQKVTEAHVEELEATLEAAVADPDAARALAAGRLTGALRYVGLGFGEPAPTGDAAGDGPPRAPRGERPARAARPASAPPEGRAGDAGRIRRAREEAKAARLALRAAERESAAADRLLERARTDLANAEDGARRSRMAAEEAARRARTTRAAREAAARVAEAAEAALARLGPGR